MSALSLTRLAIERGHQLGGPPGCLDLLKSNVPPSAGPHPTVLVEFGYRCPRAVGPISLGTQIRRRAGYFRGRPQSGARSPDPARTTAFSERGGRPDRVRSGRPRQRGEPEAVPDRVRVPGRIRRRMAGPDASSRGAAPGPPGAPMTPAEILGPSADHRADDDAAAVRDRACSRNARHSAPLSS